MADAGLRPTRGDLRCVAYGHLTRLVAWRLRSSWDSSAPVKTRLGRIAAELKELPGLGEIESRVDRECGGLRDRQSAYVFEESSPYGGSNEFLAF